MLAISCKSIILGEMCDFDPAIIKKEKESKVDPAQQLQSAKGLFAVEDIHPANCLCVADLSQVHLSGF